MPAPKDPVKYEEWRRKLHEAQKKRFEKPEERKKICVSMKKYFEKNPEARQHNIDMQKKSHESPEAKKKQSERLIKYYDENPEARKKISDVQRKHHAEHPERGKKHSETMKNKYSDPEFKKMIGDAIKKVKETPESRKKQSDAMKKVTGTPEARKIMSERTTKYFESPEARKKQSNVQKKAQGTPEARKKHSDRAIKHYIDTRWYGNVSQRNNKNYCPKFNDAFKKRVRAFFNHTCVVCGKVENGEAHNVHHVFSDPKACCLVDNDGVYYSNLHVSKHPEKDYCIGDNPNMFVPLCDSCHGKVGGGFANRAKWATYFRDFINNKCGGECWVEPEGTIESNTATA